MFRRCCVLEGWRLKSYLVVAIVFVLATLLSTVSLFANTKIAYAGTEATPVYKGNTQRPVVALTFDDGPNPTYTPQVLDILKQYNIKATFFQEGRYVVKYPDISARVVADGHVIGNHSWNHIELDKASDDVLTQELASTSMAIKRATGVEPLYMRPPYGAFDQRTVEVSNNLGMRPILWNVDPVDWTMPGTEQIVQNVVDNTQNGSIILLHDGDLNRSQTIEALPMIIEQLKARGYSFVTIPEML